MADCFQTKNSYADNLFKIALTTNLKFAIHRKNIHHVLTKVLERGRAIDQYLIACRKLLSLKHEHIQGKSEENENKQSRLL